MVREQELGQINDKGKCAKHRLVIGRIVHKGTHISPSHVTEKQIDYVYIGIRFRRQLLAVRVKGGSDAASVHHMATAKLQL